MSEVSPPARRPRIPKRGSPGTGPGRHLCPHHAEFRRRSFVFIVVTPKHFSRTGTQPTLSDDDQRRETLSKGVSVVATCPKARRKEHAVARRSRVSLRLVWPYFGESRRPCCATTSTRADRWVGPPAFRDVRALLRLPIVGDRVHVDFGQSARYNKTKVTPAA